MLPSAKPTGGGFAAFALRSRKMLTHRCCTQTLPATITEKMLRDWVNRGVAYTGQEKITENVEGMERNYCRAKKRVWVVL